MTVRFNAGRGAGQRCELCDASLRGYAIVAAACIGATSVINRPHAKAANIEEFMVIKMSPPFGAS
jgi:hypothetical protein